VGRTTVYEKATLLRDFTLGASDGLVTTFAIVAGVVGASLSSGYIIVLGLAKLLADAVSMAAGIYLGAKSEIEYKDLREGHRHKEISPLKQGAIVFLSFALIGFLPLLPFVLNLPSKFILSTIIVGIALFIIGSLRAVYAGKRALRGGIEMFVVGGVAALIAYLVGFLLKNYIV